MVQVEVFWVVTPCHVVLWYDTYILEDRVAVFSDPGHFTLRVEAEGFSETLVRCSTTMLYGVT
jgi:hypothetical protein